MLFLKFSLFSVAPIKALCSERYEDWSSKFGRFGLKCAELTGDSQLDDYFELQNAQIIMTTPVSKRERERRVEKREKYMYMYMQERNNDMCTCTCRKILVYFL